LSQGADRIEYSPVIYSDAPDTAATTDTLAATDGADATDETASLRADIEQTRSELSTTIDAIQEKLNPQNIVDQAKETVREATVGKVEHMVSNATDTARETGSSVLDLIQQNPVPAAIAGLGLGWLLTRGGGSSSQQSRGFNGDERGVYSPYYGNQGESNWQARYYDTRGNGSGNQSQNPISQVFDTVRQNPVPAALAGLGMWMLMKGSNGSSSNRSRYANDTSRDGGALDQARNQAGQVADKVGNAAEQARDTAGQVASQVQDTAGQVVSGVQDTAGQVIGGVQDTAGQVVSGVQDRVGDFADMTQHRAVQAKSQFQRMMEENPLMVGVIAAAAGAAVGLALPETPQEHQLLGEMRDNLVGKAQEVAQDTVQKVQQVASQAATQAQQTIQEEAQVQGLTPAQAQ